MGAAGALRLANDGREARAGASGSQVQSAAAAAAVASCESRVERRKKDLSSSPLVFQLLTPSLLFCQATVSRSLSLSFAGPLMDACCLDMLLLPS